MSELDLVNSMLVRVERIWKIAFACLITILTGAIWAARLQYQVSDLADWKAGAAADIKEHARSLENIKGRMGIAATRPPDQHEESPAIVWKHQDEDGQPTQ